MENSQDVPQSDEVNWIAISESPLLVDRVQSWVSRPGCGGIVTFCGTVRDFSEGRSGVTAVEYEIYAEHAMSRLQQVAASARARWPMTGGLVLLHRFGMLSVGEISVVVAASTPHRAEAFEVARYCIDTLKHTVPVWKRESWDGGSGWSLCSHDAEDIST